MDMRTDTTPDAVVTYEARLKANLRWALSEGSRHFENNSAVYRAFEKITRRLDALGINYAVVGGMAIFRYGLRRFTEDVDILIRPDDLKIIHEHLSGLGYLPPHRGSKNLRDAEFGVRIEFLLTGGYPGDGKPKPVAFPDPAAVAVEFEGIKYIKLEKLVELKLASGMSNPGRLKDLADVMELVRAISLPLDFAGKLDPYVQPKFEELWTHAQGSDLPEAT